MTNQEEITKRVRAHQIYRNSAGEIVPGVTTVLNVLNKPALAKWANNLGLQGIDSTKYVDKLAGIGTLAHSMVECHLMGSAPDVSEYSPDDVEKAKKPLEKYLQWEKEQELEPILIERLLVSEKFGFGGQIDLYAKLNGKLFLVDFKTCKAIYPEHFHQLAAYKQLLVENGYPVDEAMILRIGRSEYEGFESKFGVKLNIHWGIFSHTLAVWKLKEKLKQ